MTIKGWAKTRRDSKAGIANVSDGSCFHPLQLAGWVDDPDTYPITPKAHGMEFLRKVAHLRPRTHIIGAATRVHHTIASAIHRFFDEHGFHWVNTPIITASDAEAATRFWWT